MNVAYRLRQRVQVHAAIEPLDISLPFLPAPLTLFLFPLARTIICGFVRRPMTLIPRFVWTVVNVFQFSRQRSRAASPATITRRIYGALALRIVHDNGTRTRPLLLQRFLCRSLSRPLFHTTCATSFPLPPCQPPALSRPNSPRPARRTAAAHRPTP